MQLSDIKPNVIVQGPIFPERVKVITTVLLGDSIKLISEGMETGKVHQPVLNEDQIAELEVSSEKEPSEETPLGLILCAGKTSEQIKLLELDKGGIRVAEYMTELPKRELLEQKLHKAVELARKRLEAKPA